MKLFSFFAGYPLAWDVLNNYLLVCKSKWTPLQLSFDKITFLNKPIANMASLPWDRGFSVVTVAMGRYASVDCRLKDFKSVFLALIFVWNV